MIANPLDLIGNTPLIDISPLGDCNGNNIFLKLEEFNLGGSIKSRIALNMIIRAEENGILIPNSGQNIIEATGGNTGVGLSIVSNIKGYNVTLIIPDNFSKEKIQIMKLYGAEVILSNSDLGNDSHIKKVRSVIDKNNNYVWLNQFESYYNSETHCLYTGPEITSKLTVDVFCSGIGSGGTLAGVGHHLKSLSKYTKIIGIQPNGCDLFRNQFVSHRIEGIAVGHVPSIINTNLVDDMLSVSYEDSLKFVKILCKKFGLLVGVSSGANICGAFEIAKRNKNNNLNIVTIAPDNGRAYLSSYSKLI